VRLVLRSGRDAAWSPALAGTFAVLGLLPRVSLAQTLALAVNTIVSATLPIAVTLLTGRLIGLIPETAQTGLASSAGRQLIILLAIAGALIVLVRALGPLQLALAGAFGRQVDRYLQERLMATVGSPRGIGHLEDPATLNLIRNAQGIGTDNLHPGDAVKALASLLPSWLQALGSALILVAFQWWLGLLWVAMWPIILYFLQREYVRVGQAAYGHAAAVRRSDYLRDLALLPAAAKELRIWGMLDWLLGRFDDAWMTAMRPVWQARRPNRPILWLATGVVTLANFGAFALLVKAAVAGDLTLASLAIYTRAILDACAFRAFDDPNADLAYAAVSVPSLIELEHRLAKAHPESARPIVTILAPDTPRHGIVFEGVTFRYPGSDSDVLAAFDLTVPAGHSLAIVGSNGAGKTTLIKLLCRLYDPTEGRIVVDGVDLPEIAVAAWQRQVAAIFQDFVQFHLSARDNVALGAVTPAVDLDRLRAAADKAGALDLIESLPNGWDTILSRQYTGGVDLSGGQWQRVALARALFAVEGGARILILDEPTASLDVRAEAALYDRFLEITAGLTTILISHRFSTVRRADRICVIEGGRVVEQGTHDDLMAAGGRYATMFTLQAARFADEPNHAESVM
jgi:ABC-type multidrug transport system fused ATPase/permease subunit